MDDRGFMREALKEARLALAQGEVPVGAVLVKDGEILARGHNTREQDKTPLGHAELLAIAQGCAALGDWRLTGCTLYVTLEPCPMCAGALIQARVERIVFGAGDEKAGCCGTVMDLTHVPFGHNPRVTRGVLAEECAGLLAQFFAEMRG